jgi:hypothetical protein
MPLRYPPLIMGHEPLAIIRISYAYIMKQPRNSRCRSTYNPTEFALATVTPAAKQTETEIVHGERRLLLFLITEMKGIHRAKIMANDRKLGGERERKLV